VKKHTKTFFIFYTLFLSSTCFCKTNDQESFVIKRNKKKKISKSKLQENLCSTFANQLSSAPAVHKKIAEVQEIVLKETYKYIENAKDGFIVKSDKNKMDAALKMAKDFEDKLDQFCKDCEQYVEYLNGLS